METEYEDKLKHVIHNLPPAYASFCQFSAGLSASVSLVSEQIASTLHGHVSDLQLYTTFAKSIADMLANLPVVDATKDAFTVVFMSFEISQRNIIMILMLFSN